MYKKHKTKHEKYHEREKILGLVEKKVPYCVEPARGPDQLVLCAPSRSGTLSPRKWNMVKTCPKGLSFSFAWKRKVPRTKSRDPWGESSSFRLVKIFSLSNLANHACAIVQISCSKSTLNVLMLLRKLLLSITGNCWRPPLILLQVPLAKSELTAGAAPSCFGDLLWFSNRFRMRNVSHCVYVCVYVGICWLLCADYDSTK